jgi:hypothetical protein
MFLRNYITKQDPHKIRLKHITIGYCYIVMKIYIYEYFYVITMLCYVIFLRLHITSFDL